MKTLNINDCDKYQIISQAIGKGFLFTDSEGEICDYNAESLNFFDVKDKESLKNENIFTFFEPQDVKNIKEILAKLDLNSPYHFFVSSVSENYPYPLEVEAIKLLINNQSFIVFLITECFDTKNISPYKAKNLVEFEKSNVLYAMEIASSYLANIHKRITSPIEKIKNYCSLLEKEMNIYGLSKFSKDLKKINAFTKEMNVIINDLAISPLAILSQDANYLEKVDISSLVEEVATIVNIIAKRKNISLVLLYPPDIGDIYTNKLCLFYCLINILDNIFYHNENSYISISLLRKKASGIEFVDFEINISAAKNNRSILDSNNVIFAKECMQKLNGIILEKDISQNEKAVFLRIPIV